MIEHSESIVALATALLKFQGALKGVKRDSDNPFFKSKYADLEQVVETAKPHLQDAGIAFIQSPGKITDGCLSLTTMLVHAESGEWMRGTGEIPLGKKDPQGAGSAQTYAQRYHLMAMLGLPPVDDDGEGAMERNGPAKPSEKAAGGNKPQSTFNTHLNAIQGAKTEPELRKAWAAMNADKSLSEDDYSQLNDATTQRKGQLTKPSVEPNFEGLEQ